MATPEEIAVAIKSHMSWDAKDAPEIAFNAFKVLAFLQSAQRMFDENPARPWGADKKTYAMLKDAITENWMAMTGYYFFYKKCLGDHKRDCMVSAVDRLIEIYKEEMEEAKE